jgi:hypothetical protein
MREPQLDSFLHSPADFHVRSGLAQVLILDSLSFINPRLIIYVYTLLN